jgi:hypothetical protein
MALCIYFKPDFSYSHSASLTMITQVDPGYFAVIYTNQYNICEFNLWLDFTQRSTYVTDHDSRQVMNSQSKHEFNSLPNEIKTFFLLGGLDAIIDAS